MADFIQSVGDWLDSTKLHEQVVEVDFVGLFTNPWFLVPFGILLIYLVWKQNWSEMALLGVLGGLWWFSGSEFMDDLIVRGELQMEKILPVVSVWVIALAVTIYIFFGRSD